MSRCLAFSPAAFSNRHSNHDALIKLQKEEERNAEKRREKEVKRKLRKELKHKDKKRHKYVTADEVVKRSDKKYYQDLRIEADFSAHYPSKCIVDESEQSEKSNITVEYDPPTCSASISSVPVSTENTNKRKRHHDSVNGTESRRNVLRIRLPLKKHSETGASLIEQGKNCPKNGSEIRPLQRTEQYHSKTQTRVEQDRPSSKPRQDLPLSAPGRTETGNAKKTSSTPDKSQSEKSMYEMLFETLVLPSRLQLERNDFDDEDWLFGSRNQQHNQESKRLKAGQDEGSCSWNTTLLPQAQYLPEVDIYSLPYTVPF